MLNTKRIEKIKKKIDFTIDLPGSKSYTNRSLVMASLALGKSIIRSPLKSDDTKFMIESLRKLGIQIDEFEDRFEIYGNGGKFNIVDNKLFAGIAGTTSRFLTAIACITGEIIEIHGEGKLLERPIGDLVDGIEQMGINVNYLNNKCSIPIQVDGRVINNNEIKMRGNISSQFFSALLMIAPCLDQGLIINVEGDQVSKSYIDMTIQGMKDFGVEVENHNYKKYIVHQGQSYKAIDYKVEGDLSSSSYFIALGCLHEGRIEISNINPDSVQGDKEFSLLAEKMGAKIEYDRNSITVYGGNKLNAINCNMELMPDTSISLAVIAAFAHGETTIEGLSTLKVKETDRLQAMKNEFDKLGIKSIIGEDFIKIIGNPELLNSSKLEKPVSISTYHDHRIAMSFGILGTVLGNILIENPSVVNKSFPHFWEIIDQIFVNK